MHLQVYATDDRDGWLGPETPEEDGFVATALERYLAARCAFCGERRPLDDVLCGACRALVRRWGAEGWLREGTS